jgi:hypothetical protein
MRRYIPAMVAGALLCGACYHVTVITGAPPATTPTIDKQWQNTFVYGLVPPAELSAKEGCAQGVAQVDTERSFLNGLVGAITWSIYTPMHVTVTCASGPVRR